jgi:hypothetical protein
MFEFIPPPDRNQAPEYEGSSISGPRHTLGRVRLGRLGLVRGDAARRWLAVGLGVVLLASLPAVIAAWPAPRVAVDAARLRDLVLGSGDRPYQGYVDTQGRLDVPDLPVVGDVLALAGGATRIRAWYAGPRSWRVAVLTTTGERDIYRSPDGTFVWDFERNLIGFTPGDLPVRLPWAADVVPPELARRILQAVGPGDAVTSIPSRRVAGVTAAGLRITPADPQTTVAAVDIWADPDTGLPLRVQLTGKGATVPVLVTEFLDVAQTVPDAEVLRPGVPDTAGLSVASGEEVASAVGQVAPVRLPSSLVGRPAVRQTAIGVVPGIAAYGKGLSTFVVLALPGRVGGDALETARKAGGIPLTSTTGAKLTIGPDVVDLVFSEGYELRADVLTAVLVRPLIGDERGRRRTFLLAGMVEPDLLRQAATELLEGGL